MWSGFFCAIAIATLGSTHALPTHQLLSGPNLAAEEGLQMPFVGLGNGDHSPIEDPDRQAFHTNLTAAWLRLGGSRLDGADSCKPPPTPPPLANLRSHALCTY
jgi:hypothetical protein